MDLMREEQSDIYEIKTLQEKILEIAIYIDRVCQENNIEYFLMGGSALGAIRHKGFIPWDDDLDIFMTVQNYEKFRRYFEKNGDKNNFYLQELSRRGDMIASAKLRLNNTAYIESATMDWKIHQGIFVDIFILHNTSEKSIKQMIQCFAAKYILIKGQSIKNIEYQGIKKIVTRFMRCFPKDFGTEVALKRLYKYDNVCTKNVCHFMGKAFFKKGIYEKVFFEKPIRVDFENVMLNVPNKVDEYLKGRFGNYMKMPNEEEIKTAQHAWKWNVNVDFSKYTNKKRLFEDEKYLV